MNDDAVEKGAPKRYPAKEHFCLNPVELLSRAEAREVCARRSCAVNPCRPQCAMLPVAVAPCCQ
eukprot:9136555-Alexandrium_andersonii.AAC.1